MKIAHAVIVLFLFAIVPLYAATPEKEADAYLSGLLRKKSYPGFSILVSCDGKVLFNRSYGMADKKAKRPNKIDTPFRVGSITKQFTAAAILLLQERRKLKVTDSLTNYFPEWPNGNKITLHHLLTHTSGLYSYTSHPSFAVQVRKQVDMTSLIESIQQKTVHFAPGEEMDYCNSGYLLLGLIVEMVSGKSYGEFLRAEFFEPIGMTETGLHQKGKEPKDESLGYSKGLLGYKLANNWDMSWAGGAGALYSTTGDLHLWNEAVFGGKVLNKESLKAAFSKVKLADESIEGYGYGWVIGNVNGKPDMPVISHGGGLEGFQSFLLRLPNQRYTIVALANSDSGYDLESMAAYLAGLWLEKEMASKNTHLVNKNLIGKKYDDYVGRYDYGEAVLVVTRKNDQLFAKLGKQHRFEIFPITPDEFFWKIVEARVKFKRDANGNVHHAIHQQNGNTIKAPRLK